MKRYVKLSAASLLSAAVIALISSCGPSGTSPDAQPSDASSPASSQSSAANAPTPWLKPEDVVLFPQGMMACLDRDDLQQVIQLGSTGHKTQMLAYFDPNSDGGLRCVMLSPKKRYKVIDSEANDPNMPDALIVQVVGDGIQSADKGAYAVVLDRSMAVVQR